MCRKREVGDSVFGKEKPNHFMSLPGTLPSGPGFQDFFTTFALCERVMRGSLKMFLSTCDPIFLLQHYNHQFCLHLRTVKEQGQKMVMPTPINWLCKNSEAGSRFNREGYKYPISSMSAAEAG